MSDEIPRIGGRFAPGAPGRPKGARSKISESFLKALHEDFEANGVNAVKLAREADPMGYVKVVAGLLPKEITGEDGGAILQRIERVIINPEH